MPSGQFFNSYGTIVRSKIAVHPSTQLRLGYAFVEFESPESAAKAIAALNGFEIDKKKLKVSLAKGKDSALGGGDSKEPRTNLYVMGLPPTYSKTELDTIFSVYGKIVGSRVMLTTTGESKGVGLVRFASAESAQRAIEAVNGTVPAGFKDPLTVQYAKEKEPSHSLPAFGLPRSSPVSYSPYGGTFSSQFPPSFGSDSDGGINLYITGLPESFSKLELDGLFAPYARVLGSRILKTTAGTTKGVSFVRLETHEGALAAIQALNGSVPPKGTDPIGVKLAKNQVLKKGQPQQQAPLPPSSLPPSSGGYGAFKTSTKSSRFNPMGGRPAPAPGGNPYESSAYNGSYGYQVPATHGGYPPQGQEYGHY